MDTIDLLNELNVTIAAKQRTLDTVISASSLLLIRAIQQLGDHGAERARLIAAELENAVKDDRVAYGKVGGLA